jgi:hypothetical protein
MIRTASAIRYLGTYWVLLAHFAACRGWRFALMLLAVLANAVLHPVPFLLLAELLRGAQSGSPDIALGWHALTIHVRPDLGVLFVFLAGSGSYLLSYAVGRLVNVETIAWQNSIFWRLIGDLPHIARWDRMMDFGVMLRPIPLSVRIESALRGAFPIGRLVETGARDAVMIVVLGSILIWTDARSIAVLAFISLLFVPAYAIALSRLVRMQAKSNAGLVRLRQPLVGLLSGDLVRKPGRSVDIERVQGSMVAAVSRGYGSQSYLLNEQNAVSVVAGLHVFASFYGVYLSEGRSLVTLPPEKIAFFFFLILMLRSMISLIGLLSRMSRGYERLGLMRMVLQPAAKPMDRLGGKSEIRFALATGHQSGAASEATLVSAGEILLYVAPEVFYSYQLLPLSNALQPLFAAGSKAVRHIPLLDEADVPDLVSGATIAVAPGEVPFAPAGQLPARSDPVDLANAPVVAVTRAAFERLQRERQLPAANAGRVLVVAVSGIAVPQSLPPQCLCAASDGRAITWTGLVETIDDLRKTARLAPQKQTENATEEDEAEIDP